ncbi:MAG TPA: hypothetical protein VJT33_15000 [bacterium]|nr:hypothetical protein [bacterium]
MSVVTPDHLTSMDFHVSSYSGSTYNAYAGADNYDLKGPGIGQTAPSIWVNSGVEATPAPKAPNNVSGSTLNPDGVTTEGGMPHLGGLIRSGELAAGIRHALAMATNSLYLSPGFVWPDSSTSTVNRGSGGNFTMGSLLAIPASVNLGSLGLQTSQGMNIAKAFQWYGGYVRDVGNANGIVLYMDYTARNELPTSSAFSNDLTIIARQLQVITNSNHNGGAPQGGYKLDGGDGTLLAPLAPMFGSTWGGGNGRSSYYIPRFPRSIWAWITQGLF